EPLLKTVKHKNPVTQFLAAEGLARGRRGEGMQVLLSGIEYLEDVNHRMRAVRALGELGDPRSVDKLLQLASEDGHALQESTADDEDLVSAAFASARRLFGKDSLEPHYHLIQNSDAEALLDGMEDGEQILEAVVKKGDALRIMEVFPVCPPAIQEQLESALLT